MTYNCLKFNYIPHLQCITHKSYLRWNTFCLKLSRYEMNSERLLRWIKVIYEYCKYRKIFLRWIEINYSKWNYLLHSYKIRLYILHVSVLYQIMLNHPYEA